MAIITPIISTALVPFISVTCPVDFDTGSSVTYSEIISSLGSFNYEANFFYTYSQSCIQVGQVYNYNATDTAGNQVVSNLPFIIEPYQYQCASYFYPDEEQVIFDGSSQLSFNILPATSLVFKMYANTAYVSAPLDQMGDRGQNAFKNLENQGFIQVGFFDDYCSYLLDTNTNINGI
jgi:hypothetical protein